MHSHTPFKPRSFALALALAAAFATGSAGAGVTDADILNDAKTNGDVVSFGMGTQGQRHSTMTVPSVSASRRMRADRSRLTAMRNRPDRTAPCGSSTR